MQRLIRTMTMAIFVPLLLAPVFAQTSTHTGSSPGFTSSGMTAGQHRMPDTQSAADREMMTGMRKMNEAMNAAPMSGDPDRDFVAMIVPHHQGAIDMAEVELRYGKDPALRGMAADIVTAQKKEIAEMQRWQARHQIP